MSTTAQDLRWWQYIDDLQKVYAGFVESLDAEGLTRLRKLAHKAAESDWRLREFRRQVENLKLFESWQTPAEEQPAEDEEPEPGEQPAEAPTSPTDLAGDTRADVRETLRAFLIENQLPVSLMGFIEDALTQNKPFAQVVAELRETPEYKAAYPENDLRIQNGFDWRPEAEIRAYRSEFRRIADAFGFTASNTEIANFFAQDKSLGEWERTLQTWADFQQWGPTVRAVFEQELGYSISDDRAFAFLAPFIPTPELDHAWEMAMRRGRPAMLGLGIRPEEEAELLRRFGIDVEAAFRGYQGIVAELPRAERLAAIEGQIGRQATELFPATGTNVFAQTPFADLFQAVFLQSPDAIARLQAQMSREVARFQAGGAPAGGGAGLLSPAERAAL
jgi:hypothetical protein